MKGLLVVSGCSRFDGRLGRWWDNENGGGVSGWAGVGWWMVVVGLGKVRDGFLIFGWLAMDVDDCGMGTSVVDAGGWVRVGRWTVVGWGGVESREKNRLKVIFKI